MADAAERDLDEHLAGSWFGYRNIFHRNLFGVGVETLGSHGPGQSACHVAPVVMPATIGIMSQPLLVEQSRDIPVDREEAFRDMVPIPLPTLFRRWYGPIPPIKQVLAQTGDWDAVGQTRTVVLTGGGSMREELTQFDPPNSFGYTLTDIKGPLSPLVGRVEGEWRVRSGRHRHQGDLAVDDSPAIGAVRARAAGVRPAVARLCPPVAGRTVESAGALGRCAGCSVCMRTAVR